jgi:hypothetical protein
MQPCTLDRRGMLREVQACSRSRSMAALVLTSHCGCKEEPLQLPGGHVWQILQNRHHNIWHKSASRKKLHLDADACSLPHTLKAGQASTPVSSAAGSPSLTAAAPAPPPAQTPAQAAAAATADAHAQHARAHGLVSLVGGFAHQSIANLRHCDLQERQATIGMLLPVPSLHDAPITPQFSPTHDQQATAASVGQ